MVLPCLRSRTADIGHRCLRRPLHLLKMAGKVYLIGAGPGDPGLLTLKGKAAIERADCVVYDFLAARELLRFCRPKAEKVFAGKRGSAPRRSQEEINQLLITKSRAGLVVARLKGGDPFVFGRGGEEAEALAGAGIPFEIIPGVTSGIAAPAYAGIPLTHRELASSVCFVAGQEDPSKAGRLVNWQDVAGASGTLVFFMGTRNLAAIARTLIERGRDKATPVAVIRWGTRPEQQAIVGTLADIAERAEDLQPPTVIVVGEVVRLRERLRWFERLPLFGRRIVVTRAREQAAALREPLEERGAAVVEIPAIELRPPASWAPLDNAIRRLSEFHFLLVTSVNGVRNFMARMDALGHDARDLKGLTIGAIGPATAGEFRRYGVRVDFVPSEYRAEGLLEALAGQDIRGRKILIPRAKVARDLVAKALEKRGARVEVVVAYETVVPSYAPGELEALLDPPPDVFTFTSSSTATHFVRLLADRKLDRLLRESVIASIGPVTSATLRKLGFPSALEATESTMSGVVQALEEHFSALLEPRA